MQIISYLIIGLIIACANYFLFDKKDKLFKICTKFIGFLIVFNILTLAIFKYLFKTENIFEKSTYTIVFSAKYIALALLLGGLFLLIKAVLTTKIKIPKIIFRKKFKLTKKMIFVQVLSTLLIILGGVFVFFSDWFIAYFGEITPEQFLFNLKSPLKGTSSGMTTEILTTPVFAVISSILVFLIVICFSYEIFIKGKNKEFKILSRNILILLSFVVSIFIAITGVNHGIKKLSLAQVAEAYFSDSSYIKDNYKNPNEVKLTFPKEKRNLIHIYLESIENSYFSKELGGHMDENLMPELTQLSKEGISFSHNEQFGGPRQTYGSSWSVASMINMGSGLPLKTPMSRNSYGKNGTFLPGAITIGDILEAQGYNQTIMFGADADFGGLTTYFDTHGKFNIFDHKAAIKKELIPEDYYVWWGYEDDKLYEYAKDELTRLASEGKPFNFTMETADTHFPDGYLSEKAEKKYDKPYANAIAYSTKEAVDFIRWIQKQPFYENTTIVVTGDHLSMDKNFFTDFDKSYRRSVFNLILNSPIKANNTTNREFAPFDMFPTIMASMDIDIEGNKLGLGTNLFSNEKTLIERDGLKTLNDSLNANSNFFMDEFIDVTKDSIFENTLVTEK